MSAHKITCPKCSKPFGVLDEQVGQTVYCPHCGKGFKTRAPKAQGASLQSLAAAQLYGPADADASREPPRPSEGDVAAEAMARGFPADSAGPSRSATASKKPAPSASARGHSPSVGHYVPGRDPALRRAPVRSSGALAVWLVIIGVGIIGTGIGLYFVGEQRKAEKAAALQREEDQRRARQKRRDDIDQARAEPGVHTGTALDERVAQMSAQSQDDEVETDVSPLIFNRMTRDSIYYENRDMGDDYQREVLFGYLENPTDDVVRKTVFFMSVRGGQTKKPYGEIERVIRDVEPGERVYIAFDYKFVKDETVTEFSKPTVLKAEPDKPFYDIEVNVQRIVPRGRKRGEVVVLVSNESDKRAPVVDIDLVFLDNQEQPSGYASKRILQLRPGERREVTVPWEHWESAYVRYVKTWGQVSDITELVE